MNKSILAILTMSVAAVACGGGDATDVSAAAPASAPVADAAPAPEPAVVPAQPDRSGSGPRTATRPAPARAPRSEAVKAPATEPVAPRAAVPEYREFVLPAGMTLPLELKSALASDVSQVEDTVRVTLRRGVMVDGEEVLPAGTELTGVVTEAERAGRVKGRARISFQITSLRYDSERLAVQTEPILHEAEATKGEDATKIGVGAGAGAVIGGLLGGKGGAVKGAAIGGAAGTGAVMATRGKEVRLEPGAELSTRLTAPLAVRVRLQ